MDNEDNPVPDVDIKVDGLEKGKTGPEGKLVVTGNFLEGESIEIQAIKNGLLVMDPVKYLIKAADNEKKLTLVKALFLAILFNHEVIFLFFFFFFHREKS